MLIIIDQSANFRIDNLILLLNSLHLGLHQPLLWNLFIFVINDLLTGLDGTKSSIRAQLVPAFTKFAL